MFFNRALMRLPAPVRDAILRTSLRVIAFRARSTR